MSDSYILHLIRENVDLIKQIVTLEEKLQFYKNENEQLRQEYNNMCDKFNQQVKEQREKAE